MAQSINVPSVKVLYLAGLSDSIRLARDMGIQSLSDKGDYGLTLVLGGGEVTPSSLPALTEFLPMMASRLIFHRLFQ